MDPSSALSTFAPLKDEPHSYVNAGSPIELGLLCKSSVVGTIDQDGYHVPRQLYSDRNRPDTIAVDVADHKYYEAEEASPRANKVFFRQQSTKDEQAYNYAEVRDTRIDMEFRPPSEGPLSSKTMSMKVPLSPTPGDARKKSRRYLWSVHSMDQQKAWYKCTGCSKALVWTGVISSLITAVILIGIGVILWNQQIIQLRGHLVEGSEQERRSGGKEYTQPGHIATTSVHEDFPISVQDQPITTSYAGFSVIQTSVDTSSGERGSELPLVSHTSTGESNKTAANFSRTTGAVSTARNEVSTTASETNFTDQTGSMETDVIAGDHTNSTATTVVARTGPDVRSSSTSLHGRLTSGNDTGTPAMDEVTAAYTAYETRSELPTTQTIAKVRRRKKKNKGRGGPPDM